MKRCRYSLILRIVFLFSLTAFSSSLAQQGLPTIVKKISPSVVVIVTFDKDRKKLSQGSGFFINEEGHIITSRHVLDGASYAEAKTPDGKIYAIKNLLAEDREGDLIHITAEISQNATSPVLISTSLPEIGERVVVIGSPLGLEQTVSDGIISSIRQISPFGKTIQITAPISPGSSGSPVVNMKGEVIGVATFQMVKGQNLNFAIPSERVTRLAQGKTQTLAKWKEQRVEENVYSAPITEILRVIKMESKIFIAASIKKSTILEFPLTSQAAEIQLKDGRAFPVSAFMFRPSSPPNSISSVAVVPGNWFTRTKIQIGSKDARITTYDYRLARFFRGSRFLDEELYLEMVFDVLNANEDDIEYLRILNMNYTPIPSKAILREK